MLWCPRQFTWTQLKTITFSNKNKIGCSRRVSVCHVTALKLQVIYMLQLLLYLFFPLSQLPSSHLKVTV